MVMVSFLSQSDITILIYHHKDLRLNLLIESPSFDDLKITGSKLPTYNQVLLCYLAKNAGTETERLFKKSEIIKYSSLICTERDSAQLFQGSYPYYSSKK